MPDKNNAQAPVYVTKPFFPPREEFDFYVDKIWESGQLTNRGPLLREFEEKISDYLQVDNFQFVANGTLALQLAIDGLGITDGEIITTPFSYVATTSAILWQRCEPIFVDIDERTLNIDPLKIEVAITPNTKAILAVHVFGNACDVEAIQKIADKHNLKVIYDGAHAFGAKYKGKSLLDYGDVSIVSFHATKLFHTIEGGGIVSRNRKIHKAIDLRKRFGHNNDDHFELGINAKASEFQAAMGLANLPHINDIIGARKVISDIYSNSLSESKITRPEISKFEKYNFSYYPIILENENKTLKLIKVLEEVKIYPRRYFYPSLSRLPYLDKEYYTPVAEDIAKRILCLPLYYDIKPDIVKKITEVINE